MTDLSGLSAVVKPIRGLGGPRPYTTANQIMQTGKKDNDLMEM